MTNPPFGAASSEQPNRFGYAPNQGDPNGAAPAGGYPPAPFYPVQPGPSQAPGPAMTPNHSIAPGQAISPGRSISPSSAMAPSAPGGYATPAGHPAVAQPRFPGAASYPSAPPPNHMVLAIISLILGFLPFGVVALVQSVRVGSAFTAGDLLSAQTASRKARKWAITSLVTAVVLFVLLIVASVLLPVLLNMRPQ